MSLEIECQHHADTTLIVLKGPLDSVTSSSLQETIAGLIDQGQVKVAIDLAGLTMITSAGIGELAGAFNDLDDQGGELCLAAVPDQAARALQQLALLDMFRVFPDAQAALAAL